MTVSAESLTKCIVLVVHLRCRINGCVRKHGRKCFFLFNDALNTFYLRLYGVIHMVKNHSDSERGNPLSPHGRLTARVLLYASSHRQDKTYHGLCYTSRGALAGTRNSPLDGDARDSFTIMLWQLLFK